MVLAWVVPLAGAPSRRLVVGRGRVPGCAARLRLLRLAGGWPGMGLCPLSGFVQLTLHPQLWARLPMATTSMSAGRCRNPSVILPGLLVFLLKGLSQCRHSAGRVRRVCRPDHKRAQVRVPTTLHGASVSVAPVVQEQMPGLSFSREASRNRSDEHGEPAAARP